MRRELLGSWLYCIIIKLAVLAWRRSGTTKGRENWRAVVPIVVVRGIYATCKVEVVGVVGIGIGGWNVGEVASTYKRPWSRIRVLDIGFSASMRKIK